MAILCMLLLTTAEAALKPGDIAPSFKAPVSLAGQASEFSLQAVLSKGPVIIYFYPSAYTGGGNVQAHLFSQSSERIRAAGASVVGVSLDSIDRLHVFSADPQYCANKLLVASDADGSVAKRFGLAVRSTAEGKRDTRGAVIQHGRVERATFIVGQDGRVIKTIRDRTPADNVSESVAAVEALARSRQASAQQETLD